MRMLKLRSHECYPRTNVFISGFTWLFDSQSNLELFRGVRDQYLPENIILAQALRNMLAGENDEDARVART